MATGPSRSLAFAVVLAFAGTALAGCFHEDRFSGHGTLRVLLHFSDKASAQTGNGEFPNKMGDFNALIVPVSYVNFERNDTEPLIPRADVNWGYDAIATRGQDALLYEKKVSAGVLKSVTVVILPFEATLKNGTQVFVNASFHPPLFTGYVVRQEARIPLAGELNYALSLMVSQNTVGGKTEYFLLRVPDESGPR